MRFSICTRPVFCAFSSVESWNLPGLPPDIEYRAYPSATICVSKLPLPLRAVYRRTKRGASPCFYMYIGFFWRLFIAEVFSSLRKSGRYFRSLYTLSRGYVPRILSGCSTQGNISIRSCMRACARYYISVIYVSERISQMNLHIPSAPYIAALCAAQVLATEVYLLKATMRYICKSLLYGY